MWNKKSTAAVFAGLLIFALFVSGGCLGDGDSKNSVKKMVLVGNVSDADRAIFKEQNIQLMSYSKDNLNDTRAVLIANIDSVTDEQKADIKAMFAENEEAMVTILEPKNTAAITALKVMLFGAKNIGQSIIKEDSLLLDEEGKEDENAKVRLYSVMKDAKGNSHSYASVKHNLKSKLPLMVRDDSICKQCVKAKQSKVSLRYNEKKDCYDLITYEIVPEKIDEKSGLVIEKEYVKEKTVTPLTDAGTDISVNASDSGITVALGGTNYDCVAVQTKDHAYLLEETGEHTHKLYDCELKADGNTPKTGELTDAEKTERCNKDTIKLFTQWVQERRESASKTIAQAKPQTRFEKFMAWAKDLLTRDGVAFADEEKVNLFDVAKAYTANVTGTWENLPGFSMQVQTSIVSVHKFDKNYADNENYGSDLYYISHYCIFTNDLEKTYYKDHWYEGGDYYSHIAKANNEEKRYWPNGAYCDEGYVSAYTVTSQMNDLSPSLLICREAQPETVNGVTTVSVTHGWNISGSFEGGCMSGKPKIAVTLAGGYESSKTESYQTSDISSVKYDNSSSSGNIRQEYTVNKVPERDETWYKLTYPCDLAVSTYNPIEKFTWEINTQDRGSYSNYKVKSEAKVSGAYSKYSGSQKPEYYHMYPSVSGNIELPKPPRFCLNKDTVNFDESTGKTDYVKVYSQGKWEWNESEKPKWLDINWESTNSQLTIVADPNYTGATRSFVINLKRNTENLEDCDERTITITQSKNSK